MSSSPVAAEEPSSTSSTPPDRPPSSLLQSSTEAFPTFTNSPTLKPSTPAPRPGHNREQSHSFLEVPGARPQTPRLSRPTRPFRSSSQRLGLPQNLLLSSHGHNASHVDVSTPFHDPDHSRDHDDQTQHQRLPRALPAPSLSGPSLLPTSSFVAGKRSSAALLNPLSKSNVTAEELKSENLWADMQRTLADVELSAMNSSHLFNAPHSRALEKLRESQLALAQAWARSEADETHGQEGEDDYIDTEPEGGIQPGHLTNRGNGPPGPGAPPPGTNDTKGTKNGVTGNNRPGDGKQDKHTRRRSSIGQDLEAQTERDIKLARKRREANDLYFSQVNRGVLDVVTHLDDVAAAMRIVERESRAVWHEMEIGTDQSVPASATDLDGGDTSGGEGIINNLGKNLTRISMTTGTNTGSGTEMSDSPVTPKRTVERRNR